MRQDTTWTKQKEIKERKREEKLKQTNRQEGEEKGTKDYLNRNKTVIECKHIRISFQKHNEMF